MERRRSDGAVGRPVALWRVALPPPLPPRPLAFLRLDGLPPFDLRRTQSGVRGERSDTRRPGWGAPADYLTRRGAALPGRGRPAASLFFARRRHPARAHPSSLDVLAF